MSNQYPQQQQYSQQQYSQQQYAQQQYAQPQYAAPAVTVGEGVSAMNKWTYRFFMIGCLAAGALMLIAGLSDRAVQELIPFAPLVMIPVLVATYVMLFKMWKAIQDGHARATPGKALGFLFVPLFNYYWVFQVWPGYATDFNAFVARHNLQAPRISQGIILATLLTGPLSPIFSWIMIGQICDGVNALPHTKK